MPVSGQGQHTEVPPRVDIVYYLVPQCAPEMCVTWNFQDESDSGIFLWLQPILNANSQQWLALPGTAPGSFQFGCNSNGLGAAAVVLAFDTPPNHAAGLNEPGNAFGDWNLVPRGGYFVIQHHLYPDMNLNVAGDGPYPAFTPIMGWTWGGGAPNELWFFLPVT